MPHREIVHIYFFLVVASVQACETRPFPLFSFLEKQFDPEV